jgi:hypothetical protein
MATDEKRIIRGNSFQIRGNSCIIIAQDMAVSKTSICLELTIFYPKGVTFSLNTAIFFRGGHLDKNGKKWYISLH